jgi:hypothetical protein
LKKVLINSSLQVFTVAPALHSLIIRERKDASHILQILFDSHVDLRKLIMKDCNLGDDATGILKKIVALYPELEALVLKGCYPLHSAAYSVIPHLKKLSELILSHYRVHYEYVKQLQTDVCICEHMYQNTAINTYYIFRQEKKISLKKRYNIFVTCCIISFLFCTK